MNARRIAIPTIGLLIVLLVAGCALFNRRNENLPEGRRVKVVVFPVRPLAFANVSCRQEFENMELSASLKNISYSQLSNVNMRADVFFAGDATREKFLLPAASSLLQPGESSDFLLTAEVRYPVAYVELHALWELPDYP